MTGRGCSGVQVVARVRTVVEAAAARAAAAAAQAAHLAAIDAALVAAGQPVFANLGNLRWEAGVTQTMEPEQVRAQRTATGAVGGVCGEGGGGGTGLGLDWM